MLPTSTTLKPPKALKTLFLTLPLQAPWGPCKAGADIMQRKQALGRCGSSWGALGSPSWAAARGARCPQATTALPWPFPGVGACLGQTWPVGYQGSAAQKEVGGLGWQVGCLWHVGNLGQSR